MLSILRKSLSGESKESKESVSSKDLSDDDITDEVKQKTVKRNRSGDSLSASGSDKTGEHIKKRSKLARSLAKNADSSDSDVSVTAGLPEDTPEWGLRLLELFQAQFDTMSGNLKIVDDRSSTNEKSIQQLEKKFDRVEQENKQLVDENVQLKEKLLEIDFRQRRNNLLFEGITDEHGESDLRCIFKLCNALSRIPGLDVQNFRIDKCYRLDGPYKIGMTRRILCCFNWQYDLQCVLKNRKMLPTGMFVSEDFPEEWADRRRILRPLFNAAKRKDDLKSSTFMSKDKLIINGKTISAGPISNVMDVNALFDVPSTCQRTDETTIAFLGSHSVFSNLHDCNFVVNNTKYCSSEQLIQSEKAALFNDDIIQAKIMKETNPFKIKRLGDKVKNFKTNQWKAAAKEVAYRAVYANFSQNPALKGILVNTSQMKIVESSTEPFWGTGLHLRDKNTLNRNFWKNQDGGTMSEILARVCHELSAK